MVEFGSRFYKFIHLNLFLQFGYLRSYFDKFIKAKFRPDIIHSNVLYPAAIMGYKLAKREGLPYIITEHWSKVDKFMSRSLYAGSGKKAYAEAKYVTVVSEFLKKSLSKHIPDAKKMQVIPNVVNTDTFYFKPKTKKDKLVFSCVAHWSSPKRPDLIFNALNKFAEMTERKIGLNVVGDGLLLSDLKNKKWNFEINYLGNIAPDQLAVLHHQCDYFLHASEIETFSIVIAEALSTGTPVLASKVGAIPELVNEVNGLLCENTLESWMKGLHEITKKNYDHEKISRESNRFGLEKVGEKFASLYKSTLSR
jgi:glycosyltransferase involved in cell wall biosynthesis